MKNTFKLTAVAALSALIVSGTAHANPLESELKNLLLTHPAIKASRLVVGSSLDRVGVANAANYPKVSVTGDGGKEEISTTTTAGNPANNTNLKRAKAGLSVEQNLFNGGRRAATIQTAELESTLQQENLNAQTQDVLFEAITAYLQVARHQTLIGLAKLNEETTLRQLAMESKRVEGGGGIAVDVLQARTRLQIVRERRVFYEQGLRDASATYEQVFGRAPDLNLLQDLQSFDSRMPPTVLAALNTGLAQNPRLKAAALQIEKAKTSIELEKAGFAPSLDLVLARNIDRNVSQISRKDDSSILLRMNWVLFSGFDTTSRAAAASKDHEEQVARELVARNKAREAIRVSWNQVVNGAERLELLDGAAAIASDVMEDRKRLRDAGKETALSVLDAEVEYYGVLSNKVNAMYDTRIGSYRLLSAMGELTPQTLGLEDAFKLPVNPLKVDLSAISATSKR